MLHSKQWYYSLHRDFQNCYSTRRSLTRFFSSNSSSNATRAHYTTIQRILHPESNSTCRRQRALRVLLLHSRFQHSPIRMHILHILHILQFLQFDWFPQKTPPSTSWAITDITNITFKEREMLRYRSRCQDDIFPRIELIPSFVLSSDNTNCKNDIQLFHQLFDELSVHTDYH